MLGEMRRLRNAPSSRLLMMLLLLFGKVLDDLCSLLSVMRLSQLPKMLCLLKMFLRLSEILLDVVGWLGICRGLVGLNSRGRLGVGSNPIEDNVSFHIVRCERPYAATYVETGDVRVEPRSSLTSSEVFSFHKPPPSPNRWAVSCSNLPSVPLVPIGIPSNP